MTEALRLRRHRLRARQPLPARPAPGVGMRLTWVRALRRRLAILRDGWRALAMVLRAGFGGFDRVPETIKPVRPAAAPPWLVSAQVTLLSRHVGGEPKHRRATHARVPGEAAHAVTQAQRVVLRERVGGISRLVRAPTRRIGLAPRLHFAPALPAAGRTLEEGAPLRRRFMAPHAVATPMVRVRTRQVPDEEHQVTTKRQTVRVSQRFTRIEDRSLSHAVRVVKGRPAAAPTPADGRSLAGPTQPTAPARAPAPRHPAPPAAAMNMDVLVNQVVRQIDRRMTAWHERTGRR